MDATQIITTADGSHSLLNTQLNETYHSRHGAMRESLHVFIRQGLDYFMSKQDLKEVHILEVGFGTGLNALLALQSVLEKDYKIIYTSLEAYPINEEIWKQLNYTESSLAMKDFFNKLHEVPWNQTHPIHTRFLLRKENVMLQDADLKSDHFGLIFFDAFAPSKQPEMWEAPVIRKIALSMKTKGVFVTYCAKGQLKRDLRDAGLAVETLPGPPGKREMVRGTKQ